MKLLAHIMGFMVTLIIAVILLSYTISIGATTAQIVIAASAIIIMGYFVYNLYKERTEFWD